jgi:hypothetical protein
MSAAYRTSHEGVGEATAIGVVSLVVPKRLFDFQSFIRFQGVREDLGSGFRPVL